VELSVSFLATGSAAEQLVSFTWDDGAVTSIAPQATGIATAEHTYTSAGVYTVGVSVQDRAGDRASPHFELVVIYDPTAGFVTGGGWIQSPAGALRADPQATGKATFGFVSRYARGATVPSGKTEFKLHSAIFHFRSTQYQWLVVAGAKSQYKGSGTVNGAGSFNFLLTATDGALQGGGGQDRLRLKVWDPQTGDLVYDNAAGSSNDLDQANPQAIGGGNIVIQR
jgi:PKD repeat protein